MARPWTWRSPDSRLADIKYARDLEEERSAGLDELDNQRLLNLQAQMETEQARAADLDRRDAVQEEMRFEQVRSAELDRRDRERPPTPPVSEWMPQRDEAAALQQPPTPFETGVARFREAEQRLQPPAQMTPLERKMQERWEGGVREEVAGRGIGLPGMPFGLGRPLKAVAEPAYEYGVKPAVRGVQYVEEPIAAAALGAVSRAGPLGGPALGPSQQIGEMPMERAPIGEELVNPVSAWLGDEEEQHKAREVLDEAGLPAELMAYFFTSPLNLLPVVGFTSGRGFLNTLRQATRVTGEARTAIVRSPRFQFTIRAIASEAGGPTSDMAWLRSQGLSADEARKVIRGELDSFDAAEIVMKRHGVDPNPPGPQEFRVTSAEGERFIERWPGESHAEAASRKLSQIESEIETTIRGPGGPRVPGGVPEPELGGFPERFKGKVRALEGGPPKEPPKAFKLAPGEEPPDWYSTVLRVTERFPESKKLYKATSLARRAEMTKRTGDYIKLLDQELVKGTPRQEAMEQARRAFGGEMPDVEFAEAFTVTSEEVDRLAFRAIEYGRETGRVLDGDRALGAIAAMAERRVPRPHEISAIRRVYGNELADAIAKGSKDKDWWDTFMELWMFPKAVRSSFDISFPARQGIMVSARHPLMWSNSLKTAARGWADPKWMMRETRKLLDDPTMIPIKMPDGSVQDMRLGDLFGDMGVIAETVEPFYHSDLAQKLVPGVRRSQVSFTGAGNRLRADMTRHWLNTWKRSGVEITPQRLQRLGGLMNALSGRATIPKGWLFEMLQATWWSPQYRLSGPQAFLTATAGWALDPRVAGIATQNLVAFVGGGIGILSMLKASGLADVELDPRSSDFGKIRLGPTRINFWGSSQLLIRTIAQSITTTRIDPQLGPQTTDPGQPWARYWQSGASPQFSLITDYATGETYLGESLRPSEKRGITMGEVAQREFGTGGQRWMPLAWLDIKEGIEEDAVRGGLIGGLGMTGVGIQSYEPRAAQELQTIPEFKHLDVMQVQELKDFWAEVGDFRKRLEEEEGMVIPPELAIRVWGETQGRNPAFIELAVDLRQGTSTRREARNPDYVRFIAEHADEIREDKPDLISQEIRLLLHEMEKVQQAIAR